MVVLFDWEELSRLGMVEQQGAQHHSFHTDERVLVSICVVVQSQGI
jgi:hypothetical protein